MIVEALPEKLRRNNPQTVQDAKDRALAVLADKDFVEYCIKTAEAFAVNETELSIRTKILPERLKAIIAELVQKDKVLYSDSKLYIHTETADNVQQQLLNIVDDFHRNSPESPGLTIEQFYEASQLKKDVFDSLLKRLVSEGKLVERKHRLALPEHHETFSEDEQDLLQSVESFFADRPFNPPKYEEVIEHTASAPEKVHKILQILTEQERLVRVDNNLLFHSEAIEQARRLLISFIKKEGKLESVKFKYLLDTTRRFAIPLLDYFDRIGVTRRVGYTRYLKTSTID
jgi:selenocysteine-specific elongation factor